MELQRVPGDEELPAELLVAGPLEEHHGDADFLAGQSQGLETFLEAKLPAVVRIRRWRLPGDRGGGDRCRGGGGGDVRCGAGQKDEDSGDQAGEQGKTGLDREGFRAEGGEEVQKRTRGDQGEGEQGGPDADHARRVRRRRGKLQHQQPEGELEEEAAHAHGEQRDRGGYPDQEDPRRAEPDAPGQDASAGDRPVQTEQRYEHGQGEQCG